MMKKLFVLLTVAIAMLALPLVAHADKTKWANPNYDFNKLHRINLVSVSVVDPVGSNFTVDDMATEKIINALQKAFIKKIILLTQVSNQIFLSPKKMLRN